MTLTDAQASPLHDHEEILALPIEPSDAFVVAHFQDDSACIQFALH